jgi:hypothetical protein
LGEAVEVAVVGVAPTGHGVGDSGADPGQYSRPQADDAEDPIDHVGEGLSTGVVESCMMEPLEWVRQQGIVLQSARGPIPNLAEHIAGEPIRGSWWGHASGHKIFAALNRVLSSPDVIATRLVNGRITLIHRRLWPALVRVADRFPEERLAAVDEEHTASGAHRTIEIPFPDWVPADDITAAKLLTVDDALAQLPACLQ